MLLLPKLLSFLGFNQSYFLSMNQVPILIFKMTKSKKMKEEIHNVADDIIQVSYSKMIAAALYLKLYCT